MNIGKRLAVHLQRQQRAGSVAFFIGRERTKSGVVATPVSAPSAPGTPRRMRGAGEFQNVANARSAPFRIAHRAAEPLDARNFRTVEPTSIACAFEGPGRYIAATSVNLRA